jgi:hypothetical protein
MEFFESFRFCVTFETFFVGSAEPLGMLSTALIWVLLPEPILNAEKLISF